MKNKKKKLRNEIAQMEVNINENQIPVRKIMYIYFFNFKSHFN
jgi:hypothetical protein